MEELKLQALLDHFSCDMFFNSSKMAVMHVFGEMVIMMVVWNIAQVPYMVVMSNS